jgi:hypothetical protein
VLLKEIVFHEIKCRRCCRASVFVKPVGACEIAVEEGFGKDVRYRYEILLAIKVKVFIECSGKNRKVSWNICRKCCYLINDRVGCGAFVLKEKKSGATCF